MGVSSLFQRVTSTDEALIAASVSPLPVQPHASLVGIRFGTR